MQLFPAIDILGGRSVRLYKGDYTKVTDYGDPLDIAEKWIKGGADYLHIVDLCAARDGGSSAGVLDAIKTISSRYNVKVQTGGGIRTLDDVKRRLDSGASRVIIGTAYFSDPSIIEKTVASYGAGSVVIGIDVKDGYVAIKGWTEKTQLTAEDVCFEVQKSGVDTALFTDISRDGALTGVNVIACSELTASTKMNVIASGGVSSISDLTTLKQYGVYGAILGKAIFENIFSVEDAIAAVK